MPLSLLRFLCQFPSAHAIIAKILIPGSHGKQTDESVDAIRKIAEIYFHEHSVINYDFKHLKVGMEVRFVEEQGEKGPQAGTVTIIGS